MRALVCGGRNLGRSSRNVDHHSPSGIADEIRRAGEEKKFISAKMTELDAEKKFTEIIGGTVGGAERICTQWATLNYIPVRIFERIDRREAIADRNLRMLKASNPDLVIAFGGGESTNSLLLEAKNRGIPVIEIKMPIQLRSDTDDRQLPDDTDDPELPDDTEDRVTGWLTRRATPRRPEVMTAPVTGRITESNSEPAKERLIAALESHVETLKEQLARTRTENDWLRTELREAMAEVRRLANELVELNRFQPSGSASASNVVSRLPTNRPR